MSIRKGIKKVTLRPKLPQTRLPFFFFPFFFVAFFPFFIFIVVYHSMFTSLFRADVTLLWLGLKIYVRQVSYVQENVHVVIGVFALLLL